MKAELEQELMDYQRQAFEEQQERENFIKWLCLVIAVGSLVIFVTLAGVR